MKLKVARDVVAADLRQRLGLAGPELRRMLAMIDPAELRKRGAALLQSAGWKSGTVKQRGRRTGSSHGKRYN